MYILRSNLSLIYTVNNLYFIPVYLRNMLQCSNTCISLSLYYNILHVSSTSYIFLKWLDNYCLQYFEYVLNCRFKLVRRNLALLVMDLLAYMFFFFWCKLYSSFPHTLCFLILANIFKFWLSAVLYYFCHLYICTLLYIWSTTFFYQWHLCHVILQISFNCLYFNYLEFMYINFIYSSQESLMVFFALK